MLNGKVQAAVLVSGGGTNLQAIIDAKEKGIITSADIAVVIADKPTAYALTRAENAGIPTEVVCRKGSTREAFEARILEILEERGIDLIILAGFMCILSADFTDRYPERIINVHPALIPSFCGEGYYGLKVHEAALDYGVKVTGATVHFVNAVPDGGRIISQRAVYIQPGDTPEVLQKRVMEQAEWIILPEAVEQVSREIIGG